MATTPDFTTIAIADILDHLCNAVDAARIKAAGDQRWLNAIDAAWDYLLDQNTVSFDHAAHALRVESASEAGKVYISNGACQCKAFSEHNACWHRAAARLVRRALELEAMARASAQAQAAEELESERRALHGAVYDDALDAGADWDMAQDMADAARDQVSELLAYARAWDTEVASARAAHVGARIARAAMAIAA